MPRQSPSTLRPHLWVAATTFNRAPFVRMCAASIQGAIRFSGEPAWNVHVYDDASTDYGPTELQSWYGRKAIVRRNARTRGASFQIATVLTDFASSSADAILMADSDVLFGPHWLHVLTTVWPLSSGWLSTTTRNVKDFMHGGLLTLPTLYGHVYGSPNATLRHQGNTPWYLNGIVSNDRPTVVKLLSSAGNAGSALSRRLVRAAMGKVTNCNSSSAANSSCHAGMMDWRLGKYFGQNLKACKSHAEVPLIHIGFDQGIHFGNRVGGDRR